MRKNLLIFLLLCLLTMGAQAQLKPRVVIICEVHDQSKYALPAYRRVIIKPTE